MLESMHRKASAILLQEGVSKHGQYKAKLVIN